jgi:hypothetical protein
VGRSLKRRWGSLTELDGRARVGSPIYQAYPKRLRQLTAWRAMHRVAGGHMPVRMAGTRAQTRPSSNLPLPAKEAFVKKRLT